MTPTQQVREMLADGYDADTVVSVLLARSDDHALRTMAEAWLRTEVDRQKRNVARRTEQDEFSTRRQELAERRQQRAAAVEDAVAPIKAAMSFTKAFLDTSFSLGDGRTATWGTATPDEHDERCTLLNRQIDGIADTVSKHREIIDLLRSAGAKCLNDLRGK